MSNQRRVFNFESKILVDKTIEEEGYHPDSLGKTSRKHIWATCRFCGKEHRLTKGNFNKTGSACHRECKLQEQKLKSPFSDPKVREKARQTNLERYGHESAQSSDIVRKRISEAKSTDESKEKTKQTNLERYGVENVFQSEEIREKSKQTMLEKHGVESPQQSKEIREKTKQTNLKRYGVENPRQAGEVIKKAEQTCVERYGVPNVMQDDEVKEKAKQTFQESILDNDNYNLINTLRSKDFWDFLSSGNTLFDACKKFDLNYGSLTFRLIQPEFYDKYHSIYTFPKHQTQKEIADIFKGLGFKVLINDRKAISPLELDIYLPEKKFAIEYNGSYWHSEACLDSVTARNKHITKLKACRAAGITLINIFENQWIDRSSQFLNLIKSKLGHHAQKVNARDCEITYHSSKEFMDLYHIQGYGYGTKVSVNLEINGEIIASMTGSNHHRQNGQEGALVLNRLCFKSDYHIPGAASRLFKYFKIWARENGYNSIISWSDNCWTNGDIYKVLKFNKIVEYPPDYFYWDKASNKYVSKQSQRKSATGCPPEVTERGWCLEKGLFRLWDCGKIKWQLDL